MKTMTCKQLGGACDVQFRAETFDDISQLSRKHGMEMFEKRDEGHVKVMQEMQDLMKDPKSMQEWMDGKRREFEVLPEDQ